MPFRHVVMFRWADDVEPDHVTGVRAALDALPGAIAGIRGFVHGSDVGVSEGNFDYALVADFDDADAWRAYRDHPQHQLFLAEHITGKVAERVAVQFQTARTDRSAHDVSAAEIEALLQRYEDESGFD